MLVQFFHLLMYIILGNQLNKMHPVSYKILAMAHGIFLIINF